MNGMGIIAISIWPKIKNQTLIKRSWNQWIRLVFGFEIGICERRRWRCFRTVGGLWRVLARVDSLSNAGSIRGLCTMWCLEGGLFSGWSAGGVGMLSKWTTNTKTKVTYAPNKQKKTQSHPVQAFLCFLIHDCEKKDIESVNFKNITEVIAS